MILGVVGLIVLTYLFCEQVKTNNIKPFLIISGLILFLYASLRAHNLQPDIPIYVNYFNKYATYDYQEITMIFSGTAKDPTFHFVGWLFSKVFINVQWWLAFIAGISLAVFCYLFYKESKNPILSVIGLISLGYFEFTLSGLRQAVALSFTMLSFFSIKNKRPIKFIILVLLASLFHRTALIFLITYPIANSKMNKMHFIVATVVIALFIFGQSFIRNFMQEYLEDTQYEGYINRTVNLTVSGLVIQLVIFIFCLYYYPAVSKNYKSANILYNMSYLGVLFQIFSSMIAEMFRVSMYFSVFNLILIPMVISVESDSKLKRLLNFVIGVIFIFYIVWTGIPKYSFFWS